MDYNGGALIGMKGRDCVAIATDKRFGIQAQTVSLDFIVRLYYCIIQYYLLLIHYYVILFIIFFDFRKFLK